MSITSKAKKNVINKLPRTRKINDKFTIDDNGGNIDDEANAKLSMANKQKKKSTVPWVDKYRPLKLDDVVHQDDVIKMLKNIARTGNMLHLLFYGPAGTGKCLAPETPVILYSSQSDKGRVQIPEIIQAQFIKTGDILMGDDGTPRHVLSTVTGEDIMYKIKQEYGDEYIVNSEHIISLKLVLPYIITTNFEKNGYDIIYFNNFELQNIFVEEINEFYFGNYNLKGDICDIPIKDYINKSNMWKQCFKGFTCGMIDPESWVYENENAFIDGKHLQFDSNNVHSMLYSVPYLTASLNTRKEFVNGIFSQFGNTELRIRNRQLFDNVLIILRSLGYLLKCTKKSMYNCCEIIKSKTNAYNITIEKLDKGKYCGFEIDGNRRFLLGDFTVTHNTSSILAIANELFGPNKIDERVIELNASDERGINIVRNKIVTLAKTSVSEKDPNYVCPPYKIIILDEADAMTVEAQSALRKIMEDNSSITRFCFVCNFINQIIEPIRSRCAKFRFKPIELLHMSKKLMYIASRERVNITEDAIKIIYNTSNGDMRKAITLLQNLNYLGKHIEADDVCQMACIMPLYKLVNIMKTCTETGNSATKIVNLTNYLIMEGYPLTNILEQLVQIIVKNEILTDKMKSIICLHISNTEYRLTCGADEYMQLLSVFMCIKNISNGLKSVYDL